MNMGWVKDRFAQEGLYKTGADDLWERFLDAVDEAVAEFNEVQPKTSQIKFGPCVQGGSKYCVRVWKTDQRSELQAYLHTNKHTLVVSPMANECNEVCRYSPTADLNALEFVCGGVPIDSHSACRLALCSFLFGS
jgi:hypothetical protein